MLPPNFARLRLKDLQLLLAIAETRSLTRVAHSMGISQPALSRALRDIEGLLGVTVFGRSKMSPLEPTPVGMPVLERARILIADAAALHREVQAFREGSGGHMRLGIIPYIPSRLALSIVRRLTDCERGMTVSTHEASTDELVYALKHQRLDAVLGRITVSPDQSYLHQEELFSQSACIVVHHDSDILATGRALLEDLAHRSWVLPPLHSPTRNALAELFIRRGLRPPEAVLETTSARLIYSLTKADKAVTSLVPLNIGRELEALGGVRHLEFPVPFKMPSVGLITLANQQHVVALKHLRGIVRVALKDSGGVLG